MIALTIFLICMFVALGTGILASWSDFKGMTIPNLYSAIILGAFVVAYGAMWALGADHVFSSVYSHGISALIILVITAAMFATKSLGAADSKLGTAYAAWVGVSGLMPFLFYMAIVGGLLGVIALVLKAKKPIENPPEGSWIAQVQGGASKVPYGIALTAGAFAAFLHKGYASPAFLSQFL